MADALDSNMPDHNLITNQFRQKKDLSKLAGTMLNFVHRGSFDKIISLMELISDKIVIRHVAS